MDELLVRALTAFYRTRAPGDARQADGSSSCTTHQGKRYVVLRAKDAAEPLAVYRCMNRGELKRLKRWPAEVVAVAAPSVMAHEAAPPSQPVLLDLVPVPRKAAPEAQAKSDASQAGLF